MRHRNRGRKLGLRTAPRLALLRQLTEALFLHGRVRTTVTRAKEARRMAERLVTWAKRGTLHHRRLALAVLYRADVVNRLFDHIVEWYRNRAGGYTRIIKLGMRPGDGAPMAFLELVDWIPGEKLEGQFTKVVKKVEGEEGKEGKEGKEAKGEKGKKEKDAKKPEHKKAKAPAKAEHKAKHAKDPEKEKKKAERQAALNKRRQERAAARERLKKERAEHKSKAGEKPAAKPAKSDKSGKK